MFISLYVYFRGTGRWKFCTEWWQACAPFVIVNPSFSSIKPAAKHTPLFLRQTALLQCEPHHRILTVRGSWQGKRIIVTSFLYSEVVTRFTEKLLPYVVLWSWLHPTSLSRPISKHGTVYDHFYMCILFRYVTSLLNLLTWKLMHGVKT